MNKTIKIGSRDSRLAVAQTQLVIDFLESQGNRCSLVTMKTTGDIILDRALDKIGGKGLFVKELDRALTDGTVDLTVHSLKDLPMEQSPDLPVIAYSTRANPFDALVLAAGAREIDFSRPIGCAGARRRIQLKKLFPSCTVAGVRGNVITRLQKLDSGEYSALVLASAGLDRLGLLSRASRIFTADEMIPSAGQGVLAVQARADFDTSLLQGFDDRDARDTSLCERAFVAALDGGCSSPVAAYATLDGDTITLCGMYVDENENTSIAEICGDRTDGLQIGSELALAMKKRGCNG